MNSRLIALTRQMLCDLKSVVIVNPCGCYKKGCRRCEAHIALKKHVNSYQERFEQIMQEIDDEI